MGQKNKTTFIRVEKNSNYSTIHNEFLRRGDLSWKAKGIMAYILHLPDDWNINLKEVLRHATEGEKAFRSGWKELEDAGYVKRYPVRDKESKRIEYWETVVHENVGTTVSYPHTQNLHVGKVDVGKVDVGNGNLLSTKELSTKELSTKKDSPDSAKAKYDDESPYMKLVNQLEKHILNNNPNYKFRHNKQTWADDFRKIVELDDRDMKEVVGVLDWCQQDDFWHKNILSPSKFREQYDKLVMNMPNKNNTNHNFQPSTDKDKYGWKDQIPI